MKLFKGEKWTKAKGESEARVSYFQDTHFYATDLNKEKKPTRRIRHKQKLKLLRLRDGGGEGFNLSMDNAQLSMSKWSINNGQNSSTVHTCPRWRGTHLVFVNFNLFSS